MTPKEPQSPHERDSTVPSDDHLIALLADLVPDPTERFFSYATNAPWQQGGSVMKTHRRWPVRFAGVFSVLMLLVGITLAVPSLRAAAAQMLGLTHSQSDNIVIELNYSDPPPPLSVAAAEAEAGYDVLEPAFVPEGYTFKDATYSADGPIVWLRYVPTNGSQSNWLIISQRRAVPNLPSALIGASAVIELVDINGIVGEYVQGAWYSEPSVLPEPAPGTCENGCDVLVPTPAPGTSERGNYVWNADAAMYRIDWQVGDMKHHVDGSGPLTKDVLLQVARSLR